MRQIVKETIKAVLVNHFERFPKIRALFKSHNNLVDAYSNAVDAAFDAFQETVLGHAYGHNSPPIVEVKINKNEP